MKSIKNILITNVFGKYNAGDLALYQELLFKLRGHRISAIIRFPIDSSEVVELEPIGKVEKHKGPFKWVVQFYRHFFAFLYLNNIKIASIFLKAEHKVTLDRILSADLVLSCPGGFLEDSNSSYIVNVLQIYFAIVCKKKVIISPQSIGPIKSGVGRLIVGYTLRRCHKIYVRELISMKFCTDVLKLSNVEYSPDIVLNPETIEDLVELGEDRDYIYSTVVNWNFPHAVDSSQRKDNYLYTMIDFFSYVYQKYNKRVKLLNQVDSDLVFAYKIQEKIPDIVVVDSRRYSPNEMVKLIGNGDFFIGTRFHSCIFSFLANVPFIAISYLPKTTGMLNELGLLDRQLDINFISTKELCSMVDALVAIPRAKVIDEFKSIRLKIEQDDVFSRYLTEIL